MGIGYSGATHEDVFIVASQMEPGDVPKKFYMREIGTPAEISQLMNRLKQGREGVVYTFARNGIELTVYCSYPRITIE